jgi:hypothetical protein
VWPPQDGITSKLEKVENDLLARIDHLKQSEDRLLKKAKLLERHCEEINNALMVVNSALASGMDWMMLQQLVKEEKETGNPVACLIHELKLETNEIIIILVDDDDKDDFHENNEATLLEIDLGLSAHSNVRRLFENGKEHARNVAKMMESMENALNNARKKADVQVEQRARNNQAQLSSIKQMRKVYWWEKVFSSVFCLVLYQPPSTFFMLVNLPVPVVCVFGELLGTFLIFRSFSLPIRLS